MRRGGVRILTIGHSTRPLPALLALLQAHDVSGVADVRTIPRSRRHPHFSAEPFARSLSEAGIAYRHFPALGGLRRPRPDSVNTAWREAGFRGYADHMATPAFAAALDDLVDWAEQHRPRGVAIMCAEAVWWRCHRRLIADALLVRGVEVGHITAAAAASPHELTGFARLHDGRLLYPRLV
jgi:uncharacterized protein (DUF488 family)